MWGLAEMRARYVSIAAVLLLLAIGPVMSPPAASYVYKEHRDNSTVPPPGADEYDPLIVLVPILKDDRVNYEWHASQPLELTVLRPDGYILVNPEVGFQGEGAFIAPQTGSYRFIWTRVNETYQVNIDYSYKLDNGKSNINEDEEFDIWYAFPFIVATIVGVFVGMIFMILLVRQRRRTVSAKELIRQTEVYFKAFSPSPPPKVADGTEAMGGEGQTDGTETEGTAPGEQREDGGGEPVTEGADRQLPEADGFED